MATHHDTITWPLSDSVRRGSGINVFQSRGVYRAQKEGKKLLCPGKRREDGCRGRGRLGELKYRNIAEGEEQESVWTALCDHGAESSPSGRL